MLLGKGERADRTKQLWRSSKAVKDFLGSARLGFLIVYPKFRDLLLRPRSP